MSNELNTITNNVEGVLVNDKLTQRLTNIIKLSDGESHTLETRGIFYKTSAKANFDAGEITLGMVANGENTSTSLTTLKFDAIRLTPTAEAIAQRIAQAKLGLSDSEFNASEHMPQIDWTAIKSEEGMLSIKKAKFARNDRKFARSIVAALAKHQKDDFVVWGKITDKAAPRIVDAKSLITVASANAAITLNYSEDKLAQKDFDKATKPTATVTRKPLTEEERAAKEAKRVKDSADTIKSMAQNMTPELRAELIAALTAQA